MLFTQTTTSYPSNKAKLNMLSHPFIDSFHFAFLDLNPSLSPKLLVSDKEKNKNAHTHLRVCPTTSSHSADDY